LTSQFTSAHRLVLFLLAFAFFGFIASFLLLPFPAALLVSGGTCFLVWTARPLMLPPGAGATKVRLLSLAGIFALAGSNSLWADIVNTAAEALASSPAILKAAPWITDIHWSTEPSIAVMMFASIGVLIVNYFMIDKPIGGNHPEALKKDFPSPDFQTKLDSFCSALRQHLETTDRQSNWSPTYYTELEAEVEIVAIGGAVAKKRIVNLQAALRAEQKTRAFLVLGDPGGGKSVALRKLARDMLAEVHRSGRIPLYINLREWLPSAGSRATAWTEQSPPTIQQLEAFVIENLKARGDVFTEEFVDTYFRDLWQHGRLFFIFDSFDEIPELLDAAEESWLIDQLSEILSRFISTNVNARGVLASRMFRSPTHAFLAQKKLEIRPMSEERILLALARYPAFTKELQNQLFRDRHDLVPIARNPFLMALLGEWVRNHHTLPATQADLYRNYLRYRLEQDRIKAKMLKHGLAVDQVIDNATDIADFVFHSPAYGLEAPVSVLKEETSIAHAEATIDVLSYARIARVTTGDAISFAFVHRRFLEYLVTTKLLTRKGELPLEQIPTDARGRDAMVLFAQLCDDATAERIARICWHEIATYFNGATTRLRAIHSLRFLTDAFRSRRAAVTPFAMELEAFITEHVTGTNGLVQAKICLEATGLLNDHAAVPILQLAMAGKNSWLRETAFRACRHLPQISPQLQQLINHYVINMPPLQFWQSRRALIFSLALSDALRDTHQIAVWRKLNLMVSAGALVCGALVAPPAFFSVALMSAAMLFADILFARTIPAEGPRQSPRKKARPQSGRLLGQGTLLWLYQHAFGLMLLLSAGIVSLASKIPNDMTLLPSAYASFTCIAMLILALLSFDWLLIGTIKFYWKRFMARPWRQRLRQIGELGVLTIVSLGLVLGGAWGMDSMPNSYRKAVVAIVGLAFLCGVLGAGLTQLRHYLHDRKKFKRLAFTVRMPRGKIVEALHCLRRVETRLAVVQKLIETKTMATGDWPDGFQLNDMEDPAITELAKLEERWLKLDR
jgi:hypothetical protein